MTGRLQIDMYAYFRRDFNLSSYKLDDVAGQFISDDVKRFEHTYNLKYGDVTELFSQNLTGLRAGDFIHIELTGFTADYYKNGKKFKVLEIDYNRNVTENIKGKDVTNKYNVIIIEGHEHFEQNKSIKWGTAKDDVTPQDIFRLANGSSSDRAIVAKYCIQDCNLVHHLMNKIDVMTGYVEMSRICSVPISFLVFRGQGIKLTSYVAKKCRDKNTLMPDLTKTEGGDGYEGAIVLPPKCSMYMDNPVACVDYSSLYPSSMISQNLSHDSKVWTKEYNLNGEQINETGEKDKNGKFIYDNLPGYEYIDLEFDTYRYIRKTPTSRAEKTKCGKMICRWAQFPDNRKGIMPSILEELLKITVNCDINLKKGNKECLHLELYIISIIDLIHS
jgi:DNA polymerase elongation subunit (family B)